MTAPVLPEIMVRFWVAGRPAPQGSKRHVGNGRMVEMSKAVGPWRDAVRGEAQRLCRPPFHGPVEVSVVFVLARPKTVKRPLPDVRPDVDKLARATLDGLAEGGLLSDDGQVTHLDARKVYGRLPGAMITVRPDSFDPEWFLEERK